jgi:alkaline phosphatase D
MAVEWSTSASFNHSQKIAGGTARPSSDFTAKTLLQNLPANQHIFYRVSFESVDDHKNQSAPVLGTFKTPPIEKSDVTIVWSGDTAGQGFGINHDFGGMRMYKVMQSHQPDLFIHSGDLIYADNPIEKEVKLLDGTVWKNVTSEAKSKVAETLEEFRGNYRYNLLDENVRAFNASVAQVVQWDDHETLNNWDPYKTIEDSRYKEKRCSVLSTRARQALFEYTPIIAPQIEPQRIYSRLAYGPSLDLFKLDARSYRGPNSPNDQIQDSPSAAYFGPTQLAWLKAELLASKSTWKVILHDMPLGLIIKDGVKNFEGSSQGNGSPLGRELEIAGLLRFIKNNSIKNVVWLTADVHYAAAHFYDPAHAQFTDFEPFWEFVAGPLHSGTFGPNALDNTFGPQVKFQSVKPGQIQGESPFAGKQFFGKIHVDKVSESLRVSLHNLANQEIYAVELAPKVS